MKKNQYYLEGSLALLDQPGEWVYQPGTKMLHVCSNSLILHLFICIYCFNLITCILSLFFIFGLIISPTLFDPLNQTHTLCRGEKKSSSLSSLSQVIPPMSSTATCEELNLRGRTVDYGLVITDSENVLKFLKSSSSTIIDVWSVFVPR